MPKLNSFNGQFCTEHCTIKKFLYHYFKKLIFDQYVWCSVTDQYKSIFAVVILWTFKLWQKKFKIQDVFYGFTKYCIRNKGHLVISDKTPQRNPNYNLGTCIQARKTNASWRFAYFDDRTSKPRHFCLFFTMLVMENSNLSEQYKWYNH